MGVPVRCRHRHDSAPRRGAGTRRTRRPARHSNRHRARHGHRRPDKTAFEVTTLRRDIETFGRHAKVTFTTDWREDAMRRDFTMNALYCDERGKVHDPLGGYGDLRAGRVRFIGDARQRIARTTCAFCASSASERSMATQRRPTPTASPPPPPRKRAWRSSPASAFVPNFCCCSPRPVQRPPYVRWAASASSSRCWASRRGRAVERLAAIERHCRARPIRCCGSRRWPPARTRIWEGD